REFHIAAAGTGSQRRAAHGAAARRRTSHLSYDDARRLVVAERPFSRAPERREVAATSARFQVLPFHAHVDSPPLAILLVVARHVAERVLRTNLGEHLL